MGHYEPFTVRKFLLTSMLCLPVQYTPNNLSLSDSLDKAHKY